MAKGITNIVVVGARPAGLLTTLMLTSGGIKIDVLEVSTCRRRGPPLQSSVGHYLCVSTFGNCFNQLRGSLGLIGGIVNVGSLVVAAGGRGKHSLLNTSTSSSILAATLYYPSGVPGSTRAL